MSNLDTLNRKVNDLENRANDIEALGIQLLQESSRYIYKNPNTQNLYWGELPDNLKLMQRDAIRKYQKWYISSQQLIKEYMPEKEQEFVTHYEDNKTSLGVIDMLQLRDAWWVDVYPPITKRFLSAFEIQRSILLSVPDVAEVIESQRSVSNHSSQTLKQPFSRKVFIVHGHDLEARETVARFIQRLDLDPIILDEQPNAGKTIIEKFQTYSDVGFAVVLLTPDDLGTSKDKPQDLKPRARQNVILELGYFVAKLGRTGVCALHKGGIEIPSDYNGVIYTSMDKSDWKIRLAKEMREVIKDIDMNKL